jgi:hypothetical protein
MNPYKDAGLLMGMAQRVDQGGYWEMAGWGKQIGPGLIDQISVYCRLSLLCWWLERGGLSE